MSISTCTVSVVICTSTLSPFFAILRRKIFQQHGYLTLKICDREYEYNTILTSTSTNASPQERVQIFSQTYEYNSVLKSMCTNALPQVGVQTHSHMCEKSHKKIKICSHKYDYNSIFTSIGSNTFSQLLVQLNVPKW